MIPRPHSMSSVFCEGHLVVEHRYCNGDEVSITVVFLDTRWGSFNRKKRFKLNWCFWGPLFLYGLEPVKRFKVNESPGSRQSYTFHFAVECFILFNAIG